MLQTMAAPLVKTCAGTMDIVWRWPHCSWWINKIKLFFWNQSLYFKSDLLKRHSSDVIVQHSFQ
jgi:hypothetical protein